MGAHKSEHHDRERKERKSHKEHKSSRTLETKSGRDGEYDSKPSKDKRERPPEQKPMKGGRVEGHGLFPESKPVKDMKHDIRSGTRCAPRLRVACLLFTPPCLYLAIASPHTLTASSHRSSRGGSRDQRDTERSSRRKDRSPSSSRSGSRSPRDHRRHRDKERRSSRERRHHRDRSRPSSRLSARDSGHHHHHHHHSSHGKRYDSDDEDMVSSLQEEVLALRSQLQGTVLSLRQEVRPCPCSHKAPHAAAPWPSTEHWNPWGSLSRPCHAPPPRRGVYPDPPPGHWR